MNTSYSQGYVDRLNAEHAAEIARLQEEAAALKGQLDDAQSLASAKSELDLVAKAIRGALPDGFDLASAPALVHEAALLRRERDGMNRRRRDERRRG